MNSIDMSSNTKDLMKLQEQGVITDEGIICGYCMKMKSKFGSKNVMFSNGETKQVCKGCVEKLQEVKGVKIL